ncbi:hypothetical protein E3P92_02283 [Wallemia ichthyophaga]|nr:hypothetical protein E3P92_02283 [Wallemia ichthyophaga]
MKVKSQKPGARVSLKSSMTDEDSQLRRIHRLLRNLKSKLKLLEDLVSKRNNGAEEPRRDGSRFSYSSKQRDNNWKSLKILPNIAATDKLFNARSGSLDGINLRQLMDHIQALRMAFVNILELNKPTNAFPSLTQLSAKVVGYSIINYDLSYVEYGDQSNLGKIELEARKMEVVDYVYSCVPAHLRTLLVPSHALSLLFLSDILSNHHATVSSLLPTTRAHSLEFQDIVHQSLLSAFSSPTLPPPDYISNMCDKFNGGAQVNRSLIKLIPAYEPALATCRAVESIRSFKSHTSEIQDTSPLIQSIFESCYQSPIPPLKLRKWLDIEIPKSLFEIAFNNSMPSAQSVLLSLAVETADLIIKEPSYREWFYIGLNLCSAALTIFHSNHFLSEILVTYINQISRIPFLNRSLSEALDMFNLDLLLGKSYSSARILIDVLGENNLLPVQLCILRKAVDNFISVDGYDYATLRDKKHIAETKFEELKVNFVQTTTYKTPKKINSTVIDFTPYPDERLQSHRKLMSTNRFNQIQTPQTNQQKAKIALGPNQPIGSTFRFQAQNKLFGFGSPFVVKRDWRQRREGDDEGDMGVSSSQEEETLISGTETKDLEVKESLPAPQEDSSEYYHQSPESSEGSERVTTSRVRKGNESNSESDAVMTNLSDDLVALIKHKPKSVKPASQHLQKKKRTKLVPMSSPSQSENDHSEHEAQLKHVEQLNQADTKFFSRESSDFDSLNHPKRQEKLGYERKPTQDLVSSAPPENLQEQRKPLSSFSNIRDKNPPLRSPKTRRSLPRQLSTSQPQPTSKALEKLSNRSTLSKRKSTLMEATPLNQLSMPRKSQRRLSHVIDFDETSEDDESNIAKTSAARQQSPPLSNNALIHKSSEVTNESAAPKPSKSIPQIQLLKEQEESSQNPLSKSAPQPLSSKSNLQPKQAHPNAGITRRKSTLSDLTGHGARADPISKVAQWMETSTYTKADSYVARVERKDKKNGEKNSKIREKGKQRYIALPSDNKTDKTQEHTNLRRMEKEVEERKKKGEMEQKQGMLKKGENFRKTVKSNGQDHSRKPNINPSSSNGRSFHSQNRHISGPIDLSSDSVQTKSSTSSSSTSSFASESSSSEEASPAQDRLEMLRQKVMAKYKNKSSMLDATLKRMHSRTSGSKTRE